jgi:hypothetical protein
MKQQSAVKFLIDYMEANFHLTDESRDKFKEALEIEAEQEMENNLKGYKRGWSDANHEVQKYVNSVTSKYSFLK